MENTQDKSTVHVINLSQYTSPTVVEENRKEWVEYKIKISDNKLYKAPNGYYQYLIDRAKGSVTNGSVIGGFSKFIYGEGLSATDAATKPEEYAKIKSLIKPNDLKRAISDRKKLMMCAFQVTKDKGEITAVTHWPMKTLLPEKMDDEGVIKGWYYHPDWSKHRPGEEEYFPAFGHGSNSGNEIYVIKPYNCASDYFGEDDGYSACLAYAVLEEEIGDYQINDAQNGFTPTTILNFNNGVPDPETRREIVKDVQSKTTGSRGKKVIVGFSDDETKKPSVEKIGLDDAPDHYQYLSQECIDKILAGHRAPSELLGFNNEAAGFANNAEELKNKFKAFINFEVQPYQMEITEALEEIFAVNNITLNLYFKDLTPFDFGEVEDEAPAQTTLSAEEDILQSFINECGQDCPEEWELINEVEVDYDLEDARDEEVKMMNLAAMHREPEKLSFWTKLLSSGRARPNRKSEQDEIIEGDSYRVRYKYVGNTTEKTRPFCRLMVAANKIYRKEDIIRMENLAVNPGWGPGGANTYSIWFYKGGGNCNHKWLRQTFKVKGGVGSTMRGDEISTGKARKEGYRPTNEKEVSMMPKDMPNQGFLK